MRWLVISIGVIVVALVVGPFVYINFIKEDAPERLTFADAAVTTTANTTTAATTAGATSATTIPTTRAPAPATTAAPAAGPGETWNIATGTQVGYRVKEILFGQSTEGVGRTTAVRGSLRLDGSTVTTTEITVDMSTVRSDDNRRDDAFRGRIMAANQFPTATFRLTRPIALGTLPADGTEIGAKATGELTLRGTTKTVELDLRARRANNQIQVLASHEVRFAEWSIPSPSAPGITTEDRGLLELLLVFTRA